METRELGIAVVGSGRIGSLRARMDTTFALITYENGAVVNLGVYYALPAHAPQLGMGVRIEVFGSEGALILNDDHTDELLITNKGIPHAYIPDLEFKTAFLSSSTPGNWHLDDYWGRSRTNPGYGSITCRATGPARWRPRATRARRSRSRWQSKSRRAPDKQ